MFTVSIETKNAAFDDNFHEELASMLDNLAARVRYGQHDDAQVRLYDSNGNCVGGAQWDTDKRNFFAKD